MITTGPHGIEKSAATGWGNGGLYANEIIPSGNDLAIEFRVYNEREFQVGFRRPTGETDNFQVRHGGYWAAQGLYVRDNGTIRLTGASPNFGDLIRMEFEPATEIRTYVEGTLVDTEPITWDEDLVFAIRPFHQWRRVNCFLIEAPSALTFTQSGTRWTCGEFTSGGGGGPAAASHRFKNNAFG